jgi:hypothetical protein
MFREFLSRAVRRIPGAIGAVFLDSEGETIEYAAEELSPQDARLFGAYAGIFLARAAMLATGRPNRMIIEWSRLTAIAAPLTDDYYLVLLLRRPYLEAVAVRELERARHALMKEI